MGIHQITPERVIIDKIKSELSKMERVALNVLNRVGMLCVTEAKDNGSYIDQTGNLRSSIGYVVLKDGFIMNKSSFPMVKNGKEGRFKGSTLVQEVTARYSRGLVLIVVAGMEYAAHVETRRNVLQSSEILGTKLVPLILAKLGFGRK